jgi:hypothetical protein
MLLAAAVIPVTVGDGDDVTTSANVWLALTLGVLFTILFYVLLSLGLQFAGVDGDAPTIARHLAAEPEQQRLLQRWLERARWARFVGGFAIGRGLARPFTFFALALVARSCFALEPSIDGLAPLLGVAAWLYAFVLWWQNRRLGLDFLLDGRRGPVIA